MTVLVCRHYPTKAKVIMVVALIRLRFLKKDTFVQAKPSNRIYNLSSVTGQISAADMPQQHSFAVYGC